MRLVTESDSWSPLLDHLGRTTRLDREEAEKVVRETLAYFSESLSEFVARRHRELRATGHKNDAIYDRIANEVRTRRFVAEQLTERQIRRLIYG